MALPLRRPPVLLMAQTGCLTCGNDVRDALMLETWGRFCSPRCFYARDLPQLLRQGA